MTKLTREQVQEIAEALAGQCEKDIDQVCEDLGIDHTTLDIADHVEIDNEVFCCTRCGWWSRLEELAETSVDGGELMCDECAEGVGE